MHLTKMKFDIKIKIFIKLQFLLFVTILNNVSKISFKSFADNKLCLLKLKMFYFILLYSTYSSDCSGIINLKELFFKYNKFKDKKLKLLLLS